MAKVLTNQALGTSIVDSNGRPTTEFFTLLEGIVNLEILDGTGTPEAAVKARFKSLYIDTATNNVYIKTTNDSVNTGWIIVT